MLPSLQTILIKSNLLSLLDLAKRIFTKVIYDAIRMAGYDEAAPAGNGSDTDGVEVKAGGLPMSVMGLHVHLLVSDHSEMASY